MLTKIISGGQTGIDQLALHVAKELNFETGGTMPRGFLTEDGEQPHLKDEYNLVENPKSDKYPPRTYINVKDSDGTIILCNTEIEQSRGSKLTLKACQQNNKPCLCNPQHGNEILSFINNNNVSVLNIAGTRGSSLSKQEIRQYHTLLYSALMIFEMQKKLSNFC